MVLITRDSSFDSSSGADVEPIDERMRGFIMSEITCSIFDVTHVMFGTINEGIMEIVDELLGALRA